MPETKWKKRKKKSQKHIIAAEIHEALTIMSFVDRSLTVSSTITEGRKYKEQHPVSEKEEVILITDSEDNSSRDQEQLSHQIQQFSQCKVKRKKGKKKSNKPTAAEIQEALTVMMFGDGPREASFTFGCENGNAPYATTDTEKAMALYTKADIGANNVYDPQQQYMYPHSFVAEDMDYTRNDFAGLLDFDKPISSNNQPFIGKDIQQVLEARRSRRGHPYSRPVPERKTKDYSSFDLPYKDLQDLMQCLTSNTFRAAGRQQRDLVAEDSRQCRFSDYTFKRSCRPEDIKDEEEPEQLIRMEDLKNFDIRREMADMAEELAEQSLTQQLETSIEDQTVIHNTISSQNIPSDMTHRLSRKNSDLNINPVSTFLADPAEYSHNVSLPDNSLSQESDIIEALTSDQQQRILNPGLTCASIKPKPVLTLNLTKSSSSAGDTNQATPMNPAKSQSQNDPSPLAAAQSDPSSRGRCSNALEDTTNTRSVNKVVSERGESHKSNLRVLTGSSQSPPPPPSLLPPLPKTTPLKNAAASKGKFHWLLRIE
ncbi:hypothetical protein ElyMa_001859500 [Elysia marginata]|uniref:Uncharacterized protein n=1 Tax=Elysia marginata TaxID=1093978 RepID=A0AAV4EMX7_9GAST|nr:hypothetical protein ElyMa_001859500 [Elysia marginata]